MSETAEERESRIEAARRRREARQGRKGSSAPCSTSEASALLKKIRDAWLELKAKERKAS